MTNESIIFIMANWEEWDLKRRELISKLKSKNFTQYDVYCDHILRQLDHDNMKGMQSSMANPYSLIELLLSVNSELMNKVKELITMQPPPQYIICKDQEHYEQVINQLK